MRRRILMWVYSTQYTQRYCIRRWSNVATVMFLLGDTHQKSLVLRHLKSDPDEIWCDYSLGKVGLYCICLSNLARSRKSNPAGAGSGFCFWTHFADRAFRCCAPSVWNSLDSETLHCSSISGFKRRLKTLLFHQTFSSTTWTVRQRLWSHPTCWRYINQIIIIIIIITEQYVWWN